jgi:hypothetical protein
MFIKKPITQIMFLLMVIGIALPAAVQTSNPLTIRLRKDFGYNSLTGEEIQGTFSILTAGPENLAQVAFYIDGKKVGEANAAPFKLQFNTGDYALGLHTISATGTTNDGQELQSNELVKKFVGANQGLQGAMNILLPILGIIILAGVLAWAIPTLFMRGKTQSLPPGAPRSYSPLGGAICPKCGRPFAVHMWGFNLGIGKLDRCPYCGKWSIVRRSSMEALKAAEAAELEGAGGPQIPEETEEERLRRELEKSRYQDL